MWASGLLGNTAILDNSPAKGWGPSEQSLAVAITTLAYLVVEREQGLF